MHAAVVVAFSERLLETLPEALPWTRFLPVEGQRLFLAELADALHTAGDLDNLAPVSQLITEWQHTAEIHADPRLAAILTQCGDDYGPVPDPGTHRTGAPVRPL